MQLCDFALAALRRFRLFDGRTDVCDLFRGEGVAAGKLIDVCPCGNEGGRPCNLLLILGIELVHMKLCCRVDLVLSDVFIRSQFPDIDATGDLRAVDIPVVPIG
jgi:hypothetical protein